MLEDLRYRVESALTDIKRNVYEDTSRLEVELLSWADQHSKKLEDLKERIEELETQMHQWRQQQHKSDEELKSRLNRLETLSFIGHLTKLMSRAQKLGIEPEQLFEEALRILEKSVKRRNG